MTVTAEELSVFAASFNPANWFDGVRAHTAVYRDERIYELEMERIFHSSWVYVGHESEIAEPGDYRLVRVGRQRMLLVRGHDGAIRLLRNRCTHRGTELCQAPSGNANAFRCHYHGWTFHNTGELVGVSFPDGYPGGTAKHGRDLWSAPRLDSYRGFVFASLRPDVPALREHLGPATDYIDGYVDHAGGRELCVDACAHTSRYRGNWKLQVENGVDGYHANFTHSSFFAVMQRRTGKQSRYIVQEEGGCTRDLGHGHVVLDQSEVAGEVLSRRLATLPGFDGLSAERLGLVEDEYRALLEANAGPGYNLSVFPNLQLIGIHIREIEPVAVDETVITLKPLMIKAAPPAINGLRRRYHELFWGPAGFGTPDDLEMLGRVHDGNRPVDGWVSFERGTHRLENGDHGPRAAITDEVPQRGLYSQWAALLSQPFTAGRK
ncbi:Rieske 2Fe-2S domain-containing protein [Streptomyces yunnanensis]|uniref:Rieske 2Fe-2S domain-containing protein n=1 Tax=Streptomyces yunnanensis TaxID=156453 RepID=A0ABY8A7N6_9ACTN|nr:Rieske 2Fe-2S domain-containing protein [Streptomyces yunnanensis]WEB39567.1 Rieske 2Fe-2S domain-containing protein [Streptomyces yunnanensis]